MIERVLYQVAMAMLPACLVLAILMALAYLMYLAGWLATSLTLVGVAAVAALAVFILALQDQRREPDSRCEHGLQEEDCPFCRG